MAPPTLCRAPYAVSRPIAATLTASVAAALARAFACCLCAALAFRCWPGLVSCSVGPSRALRSRMSVELKFGKDM
ncbi:hypothetical protein DENSPDRAFT_845074 [Dentipellis sp. KUC8613]|nr:hypothetical protein DENSPDRAFT_845074 [Dentipellis sp. KUC8613]